MKLDYDIISNYSLTVQVSDAAGNTSNATITVNVTDVDADPTVTTLRASAIQNNSVVLNGNLVDLGTNNNGERQVSEYGFLHGTTASQPSNLQLGKSGVKKIARYEISNAGAYNFAITGLIPGTMYYFRAFALNDGGTNYGGVSNFSTTCSSDTFNLIGDTDGEQSNLLCPYTTHSYTVPLSQELVYSLSVKGPSNISSNVTVYEGLSTEPLYIRAGPFSYSFSAYLSTLAVSFPGLSDGRRYMVLPLASNPHRIVLSNDSGQKQSYSLNLEQYQGSNPATRRLLVAPQKTDYYDSTNDPRHFWVHVPANKNIQVEVAEYRGSGWEAVLRFNGGAVAGFSATFTNAQSFSTSSSTPHYGVIGMRNTSGITSNTAQQTNARFTIRFVD